MANDPSVPLAALRPGLPFLLALAGLLAAWIGLRTALVRAAGPARFGAVTGGIERGVLTALLLGLVGLSILQIVLRNFFHTGLIWIDPLLRTLVLWIAFLGAAAATSRGRHVAIDVASRVLPPRGRRVLSRILAGVAAVICAILANGAWDYLRLEYEFGRVAFLGLRTWHIHSILLLGFAFLTYRFLVAVLFAGVEEESGPDLMAGIEGAGGVDPGLRGAPVDPGLRDGPVDPMDARLREGPVDPVDAGLRHEPVDPVNPRFTPGTAP